MRVVQINGGVFGSTGKIMFGIADLCKQYGYEMICASPITTTNRNKEPNGEYIKIGSFNSRRINVLLDMLTGKTNGFAKNETRELLKRFDEYKPDIVHLHNIHGSYINLDMLFGYIKSNKIKTVWTLHDCWSFTGHCTHFDMIGCDKWKSGCFDCPQYKTYPKSIFDNSKKQYQKKKDMFTGVENLTIVTPSSWLGDLAKQGFLGEYPVEVINNGIDLDVFKPTESDFREKYNCQDKLIILGVAFGWGYAKGLDAFVELAKRLDERFQIVLVGTDSSVDESLPSNIISIHRTTNQQELAEIYSAADLFVNTTRQENFPTVNIESLACGTPVLTFKTGGSPEIIDNTCGDVVEKNDIDALENKIKSILENKTYTKDACIKRASQYEYKNKFESYIRLYERIYKGQASQ